jgi:hypothetical protein
MATVAQIIDLQNLHMTSANTTGALDHYARPEYYDVKRYAEPFGLLEVMK